MEALIIRDENEETIYKSVSNNNYFLLNGEEIKSILGYPEGCIPFYFNFIFIEYTIKRNKPNWTIQHKVFEIEDLFKELPDYSKFYNELKFNRNTSIISDDKSYIDGKLKMLRDLKDEGIITLKEI